MSPRRDAEASPPPAVVNVFKRCGASVTRSGKVSESVDKHLGRKALVVDGDVPAAHFVRLPKVGKPGLRLAGAYAYLQVRLDPARFFAAHVDVVCVDRARPTRSDASVDYQVGRKVVRVSVSNLYRSDKKKRGGETESFGAVSHHLQPPHKGWFCLRIDARASVRDAQKDGLKQGESVNLTFESIKSFHVGGAVALRNVFVSETPFDEESAPAETRASTKPDAVVTWLDAGPVDEYPLGYFGVHPGERSVPRVSEKARFGEAEPELSSPFGDEEKKTNRPASLGPDAETETKRRASKTVISSVGGEQASRESGSTHPAFPNAFPPASEPVDAHQDAFLNASAADFSAFHPRARNKNAAKNADPALTLRRVIGASCETSASLSATRDGLVAYAADKAVVVASLDDSRSSADPPQQILLGHAEAVSCVCFSEDGDVLATAQRGAFPSVFLWRRVEISSGSGGKKKTFALYASFRASCASAVSLALTKKKSAAGFTRVALLGDTSFGSFQTASIEAWDVPGDDRQPRVSSSPSKTLHKVLKETTRATCLVFAPGRDDRLFLCGDGFVTEATLRVGGDDETRAATNCAYELIEKPACFKDLDLSALGTTGTGDDHAETTYSFTTLAFLSELSSTRKEEKETVSLFVGTRRGVVARFAVLDDDGDSGRTPNAALQAECAFRLHDDAIESLAFVSVSSANSGTNDESSDPQTRRFAATASADGTVKVWPADFSTAHLLEAAHDAPTRVVGAAFSFCRRKNSEKETSNSDGLVVVTATSDGAIGCLDLSEKRYEFLTKSPSPAARGGAHAVTSPCHARYGQIVCAACDDGAARGWDAVSGALVFECSSGGDTKDPATSVCFRPRDGNAQSLSDVDVLAVGYASGFVRVFSVLRGENENSTPLACALLAEVADAHAPGAAVDAVVFAGRGAEGTRKHLTLFSAARDGTLCAVESFITEANEDGGVEQTERFRATRRVKIASSGARAVASASPCGGYVLVAACAGHLGAAATGGSKSSSHVLVFDADTFALKPPAFRNARGGVVAIAAATRTSLDGTESRLDDDLDSSDAESFSVFVAGDDAAAVVSRHLFDASLWRGKENEETSAASLVRTASGPFSVTRGAHAPTRVARLKGHSDAAELDGAGHLAATLGVAVHPAGEIVVTCGADGTLLVSPANAFADPAELRSFAGSFESESESSGNVQRFVGAHLGAARGVTFLPTDDAAGDSLLATVGEGRIICVWDVHAAALESLVDIKETAEKGKKGESAFAATSRDDGRDDRTRAFGLAPTSVDDEAVSSQTKSQTSAARYAPTSAGYASAPPEPWTHSPPSSNERYAAEDTDSNVSRENDKNKISAAFPSRVVGLAVGASAASAERTENAAAVAAAAAAPGALYVPELGAVAYAAGAEVIIERVGSGKTQAVLRDPEGDATIRAPIGTRPTITALARHADSRLLASASPSRHENDDATIKIWDSSTGAPLFTATHEKCGGAVISLHFSPNGERLLSLGGDPDGALRAFSLPKKKEDDVVKPQTLVSVLALATTEPVASGAWLSPDAFFVVGAGGATAYRFAIAADGGGEKYETAAMSVRAFPIRFEDERGIVLDPAPVCTAAAALERDGHVCADAFAGDSRGRVWACDDDFGAAFDAAPSASPKTSRIAFRMLRGANAGAPLAALPRGEAATTLAAFTDATGRGVFVGSARRARVLFSEHPLINVDGLAKADDENARADDDNGEKKERKENARYWYELGELALDGAVTSSHATTFVSGQTSRPSLTTHAKLVTATTSAGTAWAVDTRTGDAKALVYAHAVDVADARLNTHGDALATVTTDGAARVWETRTFAKAMEVFLDSSEEPRCVTAALCGERVALAREDGTVRVVDLLSRSTTTRSTKGVQRSPQSTQSSTTADVVASAPYAFAAHPGGGAVVNAAFMESLIDPRLENAQTPLVSVAFDGSVAVTEFFPGDGDEVFGFSNEALFSSFGEETDAISRLKAHTITKTTVVVPGGPGGVLPVRAAAFEDGVFPARVAAARDDAARVFSLRRISTRGADASLEESHETPRFAASLTFEHAPVRAEAFIGETAVIDSARLDVDVSGSIPIRSACVAWSAANAGVLYYASVATGGDLLVLDAKSDAFRDGGASNEVRTSVVKIPFPEQEGDSHRSHRARCVAVASSQNSAGDLVAVGFDGGCVFLEIAARDTAGFVSFERSALSENDGVFDIAPTRSALFASNKPVTSVAWRDPNSSGVGHEGFGTTEKTTAFVAAGDAIYAFDDDAAFRA